MENILKRRPGPVYLLVRRFKKFQIFRRGHGQKIKNWRAFGSDGQARWEGCIFLVPSQKLTPMLKQQIHSFLMDNYRAYTHETGMTTGYWREGIKTSKDNHDKYLISLGDSQYYQELVTFVSELCEETDETCLFLTIGNDAYLVGNPSRPQSSIL